MLNLPHSGLTFLQRVHLGWLQDLLSVAQLRRLERRVPLEAGWSGTQRGGVGGLRAARKDLLAGTERSSSGGLLLAQRYGAALAALVGLSPRRLLPADGRSNRILIRTRARRELGAELLQLLVQLVFHFSLFFLQLLEVGCHD